MNTAAKSPMRIVGLAGWSGAGKTTVLARVIPVLVARGVSVSTIKHAHHGFDVDVPGKDSHTHRMAGATEVFVSSPRRWAHIHESRDGVEPALREVLARLTPVDLLVSEGYKRHPHPKLEIYRAEVGKPLLHPDDDWIVAIASDKPVPEARVPVIDLADAEKIADVLLAEAMPVDRLGPEPEKD